MSKITPISKILTKKAFLLPVALTAMLFLPLSSASAATLDDTTPAATSTSVITSFTETSPTAATSSVGVPSSASVTSTVSTGATSVNATVTVTAKPLTAAQKAAAKKLAAKKAAAAKKAKAKKILAAKKAKAAKDRAAVIKLAKKDLGIRYVFGGASPAAGFDCSGFTKYVYKKAVSMNLPHSANSQSKLGKKISAKSAKPGDLVLYSYPGDHNFHVAIYLSKTKVIHAKQPGSVTQIGNLAWGSTIRTYVDVIDPKVGL